MDSTEIKSRLQYVSELLEDLRHFHYSNTHACKCTVCISKTSLLKSSIAKAAEEVCLVMLSLDAGSMKDASNEIISSSLNVSPHRVQTSPAEAESVAAELKKDASLLQKKLFASSNEPRFSDHSTLLLSSTQRDSGLHTMLNSQSISPILTSGDATAEENITPPPRAQLKSPQSAKFSEQQEVFKMTLAQINSYDKMSVSTNNLSAATTPSQADMQSHMTTLHPNPFLPPNSIFHPQPTPTSPFSYVWPSPGLGVHLTPQHSWAPNMFMPFPFMPYMPSPGLFQELESCRRFSENFCTTSDFALNAECLDDKRNQTFSYFPYTPASSHCKEPAANSVIIAAQVVPQTTPGANLTNSTSLPDRDKAFVPVQQTASKKMSPAVLFKRRGHESISATELPGAVHSTLDDEKISGDLQKIEDSLVGLKLARDDHQIEQENNVLVETKVKATEGEASKPSFLNTVDMQTSSADSDNVIEENLSDKKQYTSDTLGLCTVISNESEELVMLDIDDSMWRPWETKFNIMQLLSADPIDSINNRYPVKEIIKSDEDGVISIMQQNETAQMKSDSADDVPSHLINHNGLESLTERVKINNGMLKDADHPVIGILQGMTKGSSMSGTSSAGADKNELNATQEEEKIYKNKSGIKVMPLSDKSGIANVCDSLQEKLVSSLIDGIKGNEKAGHVSNKENELGKSLSPQKSKSSPNRNNNTVSSTLQTHPKSPGRASSLGPKADDQHKAVEITKVKISNKTLNVCKDSPPVSFKKVQWGAPAILTQDNRQAAADSKKEQSPKPLTRSQTLVENGCAEKSNFKKGENAKLPPEVVSASVRAAQHHKGQTLNAGKPCKKNDPKLNQSLPSTCYRLDSKKNFVAPSPINESYEANQSFPKITKPTVSAQSGVSNSKGEQDIVKNLHQIDIQTETKPRNRRSIFGMSPPDSHQGHHGTRDKSCLDSESDSSLSATGASESGFLKRIWKRLDATDEIGSVPSIQEVLFNCVTSSICVVNSARGGKIVSLNESFQFLIGVHEKVIGQRLFRFIKVKDSLDNLGQSVSQSFVLSDGSLTQVSGKLLLCIDARGVEIPVTVWTVPFSPQPHLTVCVVETTVCVTAAIFLSRSGNTMLTCSVQDFLGYDSSDNIINEMINISTLDFSKINKQQQTRVVAVDGETLPATVVLSGSIDEHPIQNPETDEAMYLAQLTISLFKAGLVIVDADGFVQSLDSTFFQINLGFTKLFSMMQHNLSEFLSDVIKIGDSVHPGHEGSLEQDGDVNGASLGDVSRLQVADLEEDLAEHYLCLPTSCFLSQEDEADGDDTSVNDEDSRDKDAYEEEYLSVPSIPPCQTSTPCKPLCSSKKVIPEVKSNRDIEHVRMDNGIYYALFLHANQNKVSVTFKLSKIKAPGKPPLFCLWFCLQSSNMGPGSDEYTDEDNDEEEGSSIDSEEGLEYDEEETESICQEESIRMQLRHLRLDCSAGSNVVDASLGQMIAEQAVLNQSCNASMNHSHNAAADEDRLDLEAAIAGKFASKFTVGEALGQGSFGFVRRAQRIHCNSTCVVKFIKKNKMFEDSWTHRKTLGKKVPLEVDILSRVSCDYIIKLLAVYENEHFIQMVMEDFGEIDMFDFIDQVPIDEPLACHLFRQVVMAVDYLHSHGTVHRDIKDENVVVSSSFHCKLIDFGSASYMLPPGVKFTKFRGTMEYCSPEVHDGDGYFGPELDIWALGVTLFTIVFRENPFTVETGPYELTASDLPYPISEELMTLLFGLLQVNPRQRLSMDQIISSAWLCQAVDISSYSWEEMFGVRCDLVDVVNLSC